MARIGLHIGPRSLRGGFPGAGDVGRDARRIDGFAGFPTDGQDAGNLAGGLRGDHLVDERRPLADTHDLQVSRAAVGVEQVHECLEVRIGGILVPDGVDDHHGAVFAVQQRLDIQFLQQGLRTGLVQLSIRIDEKNRGKVVRTAFCAGRTAILDGTGGAGRQNDLLRHPARLGKRPDAHRQDESHAKKSFHIAYRVVSVAKVPINSGIGLHLRQTIFPYVKLWPAAYLPGAKPDRVDVPSPSPMAST